MKREDKRYLNEVIMRKITALTAILLLFFVGFGCGNTMVPINREFAALKLGMSGDEYRAGGWHDGFSKTGKIETVAYSGKGGWRDVMGKEWEQKDISLEAKYPDELKNIKDIICVFFDDKLCIIKIARYARSDTPWDVFSQKAIDKYGKPQESTGNSYTWNDGKTTLQIHRDYYTPYGMSITFDLNVATYIDNEIYSQMKEKQKQSSPEL